MVSYDDGEYEWIDCSKEKYELMALSPIPRAPAASQVSTSADAICFTPFSDVCTANSDLSEANAIANQANSAFCRVKDDQEYIPRN